MITVKQRQRKIKIDVKKLAATAQRILAALGYDDFDLGILLTTNATIKKYNKRYRDKDKPTDILSFPYHTEQKAGEKVVVSCDEDKNLGDLIISLEYVLADAGKTWNRTFDEHMTALLAHGIAHCLGYDHINDKDFEIMQKFEKKLLEKS